MITSPPRTSDQEADMSIKYNQSMAKIVTMARMTTLMNTIVMTVTSIEPLPVTARVLPSPILSMVGRPLHLPNCSTLDEIVRSYHTEKGGMS